MLATVRVTPGSSINGRTVDATPSLSYNVVRQNSVPGDGPVRQGGDLNVGPGTKEVRVGELEACGGVAGANLAGGPRAGVSLSRQIVVVLIGEARMRSSTSPDVCRWHRAKFLPNERWVELGGTSNLSNDGFANAVASPR